MSSIALGKKNNENAQQGAPADGPVAAPRRQDRG